MVFVGQKPDKVDYWRNSSQKQRWHATPLLDIEARLNRIRWDKYHHKLRVAIQIELRIKGKEVVAA